MNLPDRTITDQADGSDERDRMKNPLRVQYHAKRGEAS